MNKMMTKQLKQKKKTETNDTQKIPYRQQQPSSTRRMKQQQNNKMNREMTTDQCNWKANPGTQKFQILSVCRCSAASLQSL